jgi:drug/metabolite transporter (DMT)-like permease
MCVLQNSNVDCTAAQRRGHALILGMSAYPRLIAAAPALFIFIWATGYVVAKLAAPYAEPLTFLLLRYAGVIILMTLLALLAGASWPTRRQALHLAIAGIGIQAIYLGGVWTAIKLGMPAGLSALIVNVQPVLTAALAFFVHEPVSRRQWLGIALGLAGVALVVWHKLTFTTVGLWPVALCVFALISMTLGTLYQKKYVAQFDLRTGQVVQFLASIAFTLPFALAFESFQVTWNLSLIAAMVWSIVVLTGGGISLMFLMLREGKATTVTSYMYLVPAVTSLMAWAMFGETLAVTAVVGMVVTLLGVYLVVRK